MNIIKSMVQIKEIQIIEGLLYQERQEEEFEYLDGFTRCLFSSTWTTVALCRIHLKIKGI